MRTRLIIIFLLTVCAQASLCRTKSLKTYNVDVCIYGATSGGVTAAFTAKKMGKSVIIVESSGHIGGMTTGGLGFTDIGKVEIIKGMALDFYKRVGAIYGKNSPVFQFEPHVASEVFDHYIYSAKIPILKNYGIAKVNKEESSIRSIRVNNRKNSSACALIRAKVFIDCSYEGDLMAMAGVSYTVGRESNSQYGETYNGVQVLEGHQFPDGISPYVVPGDKESGLLYGILQEPVGKHGEGDNHVQAYNFRITLTDDSTNKIPITRPENYEPAHYELLLREIAQSHITDINKIFIWSMMPNRKTDINNRNGFSTDMIGASWTYPEASYAEREKIVKAHKDYTIGLLYFCGHDPRMPEEIRKEMLRWGYPKDEYAQWGHFTPQLYVREARRMVGRLVMTQQHCQGSAIAHDSIGWAAYTMDSHNCGRYVINGMVKNEGNVEIGISKPYNISYRAITPKENECTNLLVPVCLSASHIAYGSIRMEPVFMVLGQTSAIAASLAIDECQGKVQNVKSDDIMKVFDSFKY